MAEGRGGLLSAGGILSIIVGVSELIGGGMIAALMKLGIRFWAPALPDLARRFDIPVSSTIVIITGIVLAVLGIIAIVGGASAVRRGSFGLSLAGAICSLPSGLAGILAIIFVALAKGEFK
jgi:hypothetical protein